MGGLVRAYNYVYTNKRIVHRYRTLTTVLCPCHFTLFRWTLGYGKPECCHYTQTDIKTFILLSNFHDQRTTSNPGQKFVLSHATQSHCIVCVKWKVQMSLRHILSRGTDCARFWPTLLFLHDRYLTGNHRHLNSELCCCIPHQYLTSSMFIPFVNYDSKTISYGFSDVVLCMCVCGCMQRGRGGVLRAGQHFPWKEMSWSTVLWLTTW